MARGIGICCGYKDEITPQKVCYFHADNNVKQFLCWRFLECVIGFLSIDTLYAFIGWWAGLKAVPFSALIFGDFRRFFFGRRLGIGSIRMANTPANFSLNYSQAICRLPKIF